MKLWNGSLGLGSMLDYQTLLFGPNYAQFGLPAILTLPDLSEANVTVIDKTAEAILPVQGGDVYLTTMQPAAILRAKELTDAGLDRTDLDGSTITFAGQAWRIESHLPRPAPSGELLGEYVLLLTEA